MQTHRAAGHRTTPRRRGLWQAVVVAIAAAGALLPIPAELVERYYSGGLYATVQPIVTGASALVPVALLDLLVAAAALVVPIVAARGWRASRGRPAGIRLARLAWSLVFGLSAVYVAFLLLWGLNYRRLPAELRVQADFTRVTPAALRALVDRSVETVNRLAPEAHDPGAVAEAERRLDAAFHRAQARMGDRWLARTSVPKRSAIARLFPLSGVEGMTNPLGLDVLLNPELLPVERPMVLAHEWAHLAGYADEAAANYVGWLACLEGPAAAQYSGWLNLLHIALRHLPRAEAREALNRLDPLPTADMAAIRERARRSDPRVSRATWQVYDRYLKAQRVEAGVGSYDRVLRLVLATVAYDDVTGSR